LPKESGISSIKRLLPKAAPRAARIGRAHGQSDARFWEPGQSQAAGGEPRELGTATFETFWDLAKGMSQTTWDRDQQYPPPAVKLNYTETALPTLGFVTDSTGSKPMSGIRVATHLRELERASPRLLLKAMDDAGNSKKQRRNSSAIGRCPGLYTTGKHS
jgi:hypothetical protein